MRTVEFGNHGQIIGLVLWFTGFIFTLNGINILGKMEPKEIGVLDLIFGSFIVVCMIIAMVFQLFGEGTWHVVGGVLLFGFTFLALGFVNLMGLDGRGSGYYCLFVAILTLPIAQKSFSAGDWRFGICWLIWGFYWFLFFLILGLGKTKIAHPVLGWSIIAVGSFTVVIPGYMILRGWW
jgi:hypothetical protein